MKRIYNVTSVIVLSALFIGWIPSDLPASRRNPKTKNIIFLIGDGMGVAALYAVMVPVFAFGPGAEKFGGIYDNTVFIDKFLNSYQFKK
jgi:alkaline phosphatase